MRDYIKQNSKAYDELASEYFSKDVNRTKDVERLVDLFLESIASSDTHILEIGPGSGAAVGEMVSRGVKVSVIDVSERMIDGVQRRYATHECINSDFLSYDFNGRTYDGIYAVAFFHLLSDEDIAGALRKCGAILKKGAPMLVSIQLSSKNGFKAQSKADFTGSIKRFKNNLSREKIIDFIEDADFEIIFEQEYLQKGNVEKKWLNVVVKSAQ